MGEDSEGNTHLIILLPSPFYASLSIVYNKIVTGEGKIQERLSVCNTVLFAFFLKDHAIHLLKLSICRKKPP